MATHEIPVITIQQVIDAGMNGFGLQLFIESLTKKKDSATFEAFSFICENIKLTLEPIEREKERCATGNG